MLPACVAVTEHVPTANSVTVLPETVQNTVVAEAKPTGRPELAIALIANGAVPKGWFDNEPNVIVWLPMVTLKLGVTGIAAE